MKVFFYSDYILFLFRVLLFHGIITITYYYPGVLFCTDSDWAGLGWAKEITWLGTISTSASGSNESAKHTRSQTLKMGPGLNLWWAGRTVAGRKVYGWLSTYLHLGTKCIFVLPIYLCTALELPLYKGHVGECGHFAQYLVMNGIYF